MKRTLAAVVPAWAAIFHTAVAAPPAAAVPQFSPVYQSATTDYLPYREGAIADWRETNDEIERLGGHMGHMQGSGTGASDADAHKRHGMTGGNR
jgi:hypothetical protein